MPPKFCDDRVRVMQADARTLPPSVLQEFAPGVRAIDCCTSLPWPPFISHGWQACLHTPDWLALHALAVYARPWVWGCAQ